MFNNYPSPFSANFADYGTPVNQEAERVLLYLLLLLLSNQQQQQQVRSRMLRQTIAVMLFGNLRNGAISPRNPMVLHLGAIDGFNPPWNPGWKLDRNGNPLTGGALRERIFKEARRRNTCVIVVP